MAVNWHILSYGLSLALIIGQAYSDNTAIVDQRQNNKNTGGPEQSTRITQAEVAKSRGNTNNAAAVSQKQDNENTNRPIQKTDITQTTINNGNQGGSRRNQPEDSYRKKQPSNDEAPMVIVIDRYRDTGDERPIKKRPNDDRKDFQKKSEKKIPYKKRLPNKTWKIECGFRIPPCWVA